MNKELKIQLANYVGRYQGLNQPEIEISEPREKLKGADRRRSSPIRKERREKRSGKVTPAQKRFLDEANSAWEKYSESSEGKAQLSAIEKMDMPQILATVPVVFDDPNFDTLKTLKDDWDALGLDGACFSLGFDFEVEFIIGFRITIGMAWGIGDNKGVGVSEFITMALTEGIDEGGLVGVQLGFWSIAPSELGGFGLSTEVDVGLGPEVGACLNYNSSGVLVGAAIIIGAGEEDGADEQESYTFLLGSESGDGSGYLKPAYQPRKKYLLVINKIHCTSTMSDGIGGKNEVFFKFQTDYDDTVYHYPTYDYFEMSSDSDWNCGRSIWFDSYVQIKAYDHDQENEDTADPLYFKTIYPSNLELGVELPFGSDEDYSGFADDVSYTFYIELLAENVPPPEPPQPPFHSE